MPALPCAAVVAAWASARRIHLSSVDLVSVLRSTPTAAALALRLDPVARGSPCDAPGFQPGYLTLMIRSTELTLVKRRSTWAITSKTSPTTPNDTPWSTHGQGLVKTLVKLLEHPLTLLCRPELLSRSPNFT
jgi:hypothetical protein